MRLPILLALLISGCTSIVPMTAMRLSGLSPTTADPADLAVDLALPEGVDVSPGTAVLTFSVARSDLNQTEKKDFILQRDGTVFTINPTDYDALRALQATSRQW